MSDSSKHYEALAKQHYENFTVGSWLLPRRLRRHVHLLYAYCRTVDDIGDEADGDRLTLLTNFERDVKRALSSTPIHPLLQAFQPTIHEFNLPADALLKLIEANKRDQNTHRYATYESLLDYCTYSANPVGHLFLALLGYDDDERKALSDATCTALQLTNFWQDIEEDYGKGRIYIPQEDMEQFQVTEADIARGEATPAFRRLLAFQAHRTRALFNKGLPLTNLITGVAKVDVKLFSYGGMAILDQLAAADYDIFNRRPLVTKRQKARLLLQTAWNTFKPSMKARQSQGDTH